ncbi:MAG: hypothetical protein CVV44_05865 [Spirochaetae bacterium HGW-Spirochaetae-1]|nr:MAG: hypothetical protein CVV44_05865 [Spirochaetae bacterium HGW-Spirochaetae-1]
MSENGNKVSSALLAVSSPPHIRVTNSIPSIMWTVVIALLPAMAFSVYSFGLRAALVLLTGAVSAVIAEAIMQFLLKKPVTVKDGSAVITGILVAMNVPPQAPVWMVSIGSFFAIIIVKQLFGGLGFNIFNPALAARAFMLASWPVQMTTGWHTFQGVSVLAGNVQNTMGLPEKAFDALTQATPLTAFKEGAKLLGEYNITIQQFSDFLFSPSMLKTQFMGNMGGCIGETSAMLLLLGGIFMLYRKVITWHVPVSFIGTVGILTLVYYNLIGYPSPHMVALSNILSGGLFLGAFFMATDMVTSPVTGKGMLLFGMGCGIITFVIRIWGGYPEGVSYSILLMNALVPLIDRFLKPKLFGT